MKPTKIALCFSLLMPMYSFAGYMAVIPLTDSLRGHLPDNSITFTDNPGGSGNGSGGGGGSTPEDNTPVISQDTQGNECAYNKNSNYVILERTPNPPFFNDIYEWKSNHFSVPVQRGNISNSVLNYNGRTYDLSWPETETITDGNGVIRIYYPICDMNSAPQ